MTAMQPLRDILNNTPADAVDVDWNFGVIESHIGAELLNRDGSVAMTGPLSLPGPPTAGQHAATKAYVDGPNLIPIGTIWEFAGISAPAGWAFCDGSSKSTTDPAYAALFAVIGYRHGGSGANFNLPDRRGRTPVGFQSGDALFGTLGAKGGNRNLIIPNHTHPINNHAHPQTDHTHPMSDHVHYFAHQHDMQNHQHDSGVRMGYNMNIANRTGGTNAIFTDNGTALDFSTRPSALCNLQEDGPNHVGTGGPTTNVTSWNINGPNANNHWTTGPNNNTSGGQGALNTGQGGPGATNNPTGGADPTNANLQPYEVVNYIVRIG